MNNLGYNKSLYILAFDHRTSFLQNLIGVFGRTPNPEEIQKTNDLKQIIYEGFKKAVRDKIPKENAAILIDEQFGDKILHDAKLNNYAFALTTEKSGQEEFEFEYGQEFEYHIQKYKPNFAKALVRYNPEDKSEKNINQLEKLKILSDFCHANNYKLLIETLIIPTKKQLEDLNNNKTRFDQELRPELEVEMIKNMQDAGIEPDVWKIEGMDSKISYEKVVKQAKINGRDNVGIVVLGRGENKEYVKKWLIEGSAVHGIIGFAIGRTIFFEPLRQYLDEKITKDIVITKIADNYINFYNVFTKSI